MNKKNKFLIKKIIIFLFLTSFYANCSGIQETKERLPEIEFLSPDNTLINLTDTNIDTLSFDRVITLGDSCIAKKQVTYYFDSIAKLQTPPLTEKGYTGGAYLFDWVLIFNLIKLCNAIKNDFKGIAENFEIRMRSPNSDPTLTDAIEIGYPHIIPKKEWQHTKEDLENLKDPQNEYVKKLAYLKEKTEKAIKDISLNTLFIFSIKEFKGSINQVLDLYYTLLMIRGNTFKLLCTTEEKIPQDFPTSFDSSLQFYQIQKCGEWENWIKNPLPQWSELLSRFTFNPGKHNLNMN